MFLCENIRDNSFRQLHQILTFRMFMILSSFLIYDRRTWGFKNVLLKTKFRTVHKTSLVTCSLHAGHPPPCEVDASNHSNVTQQANPVHIHNNGNKHIIYLNNVVEANCYWKTQHFHTGHELSITPSISNNRRRSLAISGILPHLPSLCSNYQHSPANTRNLRQFLSMLQIVPWTPGNLPHSREYAITLLQIQTFSSNLR